MSPSRRYSVTCDLPFDRGAVWEVLVHTDRLNRQIGLAPVSYEAPARDQHGIYRSASAKMVGLTSRWREYPFQWEQGRRYTVVRRYTSGPFERFEGGIDLESLDEGNTRVTVWSDINARGALGALVTPPLARQFLRRTLSYYAETFAASQTPRASAPRAREWNGEVLDRLVGELVRAPVRERYARALGEFLKTAGEDDVASLRPFDWAARDGLERDEALRTCLYAVRVGLLNLRWSLMCPNCRVAKDEATTLAKVTERVHCDLCGVDYALNFDRYVELRFAVHPSVRVASGDIYCLDGPFRAPHILQQIAFEPDARHAFHLSAPVPLRLRVLGLNHIVEVDATDAGRAFVLGENGWMRDEDESEPSASEGAPQVWVLNASGAAVTVVLEKREWDNSAATAAQVTALQEFRDLFSSEVLAPGRQVAVENVTLFFSDLSNSTALYESIGDAPAFSRVGSHFEFLTTLIAEGNGAVVKTIGDAVMAVFNRPADAVATALRVQREFQNFDDMASDQPIALKIGLHCGPALAVNSNDRLDYFGRTVNIAARAAGVSNGGDVILTGEVWQAAGVQQLVARAGARALHFQTTLRGVQTSRDLVRLRF